MNISTHIQRFIDYVQTFRDETGNLAFAHQLKLKHTMEVLQFARSIMPTEGVTAMRPYFAGELAALFHDLARFRQYREFHTFRDNPKFNHGFEAASMLEKEDWLDDMDPDLRTEVITSVRYHNARVLPPELPEKYLFTAKLVRDSDKLSIYRVVLDYFLHREEYDRDPAVSLELPDEQRIDRNLIRLLLSGGVSDYRKLTCVNDFIINLFGWINDFNFAESRSILLKEDIYPRLRALLPPDEEIDLLCAETLRRAGK